MIERASTGKWLILAQGRLIVQAYGYVCICLCACVCKFKTIKVSRQEGTRPMLKEVRDLAHLHLNHKEG